MPPVLMRGQLTSMAQPRGRKKTKHPKRRFDIALSSPGVEMRLPAVPAVKLGWRLLSGLLAIGLFALLYHLWTSPRFQVQFAEVEGNHYVRSEDVNQVLNLYNKPIFMVDPQQVEADLERAFLGLMVDSSVQIIWPASVLVTVQERQPVIAWEQGSEVLWVDAEGISFDPVGENDELVRVSATASPPAPIGILDDQDQVEDPLDPSQEALEPYAFMTPELAAAILTTNKYKPGQSKLNFDSQHGLGWHDEKHGWDIYFGLDMSNIEEKLTVYKAIKKQMKTNGVSPLLISVEHIHAPYYRLER
jgi:cell division septal protein FtsQ